MKQLEYNFKCNWDWTKPIDSPDEELYRVLHLDHACNGDHVIKIDMNFYATLVYDLIFNRGLSVDKKLIEDLVIDFETYFENKIKAFENGEWDTNHFHLIDIDAEIIHDYCDLRYGIKTYNYENY